MNIRFYLLISLEIIFRLYSVHAQNGVDFSRSALQEQINFQLMVKADSGDIEQVRSLLEIGAEPNSSSWDGATPLMYASQAGHYKIARELISFGASLDQKNSMSFTALHFATIQNHDSIAELIVLNGANVHPVNSKGVSPLHYASVYGYPFLTDLLIYYGAHLDSTDFYGNTPLLSAVYAGNLITSKILLEAWADVDKPDRRGYTPLMIAAQFNDTTFIRLLSDYGANIYARNRNRSTALSLAIASGSYEATNFLIELGASKEELGPQYSYAQLAQHYGMRDVAYKLNEMGSPITWSPKVGSISFASGIAAGDNDFYIAITPSISIVNYGLNISVDYLTRPYFKPLLVEEEFESYQFFEKRRNLSLNISKEVLTLYRWRYHLTLNVGVAGIRSWGQYSYQKPINGPKSYNLISPNIGVNYQRGAFIANVQLNYVRMDHMIRQPVLINIGAGYRINLRKPNDRLKQIEWF